MPETLTIKLRNQMAQEFNLRLGPAAWLNVSFEYVQVAEELVRGRTATARALGVECWPPRWALPLPSLWPPCAAGMLSINCLYCTTAVL